MLNENLIMKGMNAVGDLFAYYAGGVVGSMVWIGVFGLLLNLFLKKPYVSVLGSFCLAMLLRSLLGTLSFYSVLVNLIAAAIAMGVVKLLSKSSGHAYAAADAGVSVEPGKNDDKGEEDSSYSSSVQSDFADTSGLGKAKSSTGFKVDKILGTLVGLAIGRYYSGLLFIVLILGVILYLIMGKALKMKGREYEISFVVILHAVTILAGFGLIAALGGFSGGFTDEQINPVWTAYLSDIVLCFALIVLSGIFYLRKSRGVLIALMIIESVYVIISGWMLFSPGAAGSGEAGVSLIHIAWRVFTVFLMVKYLRDNKRVKDLPIEGIENRQAL